MGGLRKIPNLCQTKVQTIYFRDYRKGVLHLREYVEHISYAHNQVLYYVAASKQQ